MKDIDEKLRQTCGNIYTIYKYRYIENGTNSTTGLFHLLLTFKVSKNTIHIDTYLYHYICGG